jgi:enterochelin esterase family protein
MPHAENQESRTIEGLRQAVSEGNTAALSEFWKNIQERGAPLIEPIEGDDEHSLVTFLWRAEKVEGVDLVSMMTARSGQRMARLAETDLWYKTIRLQNNIRATYQFTPVIPADSNQEDDAYGSGWDQWQPDPFNPKTFAFFDEDEDSTGVKLVRSVLEMPDAPEQPWGVENGETPKGELTLYNLRSEILDNERRVWVYTPAGYFPGSAEPYGLVVIFDGWGYLKLMPTTTILDNLLDAGEIIPAVFVFVDSLSMIIRLRELILHQPFNQFLVQELMPWIRRRHHVTTDPRKVVVAGVSAGGLAAGYAALEHPEYFGNVLSQSGAFSLSPEGEAEYEWLARQFVPRERIPVQFYLSAGILEVNSLRERGPEPSLLVAHRHLRDVLQAKGYPVHYNEFPGGHDYISWAGSLPTGLQALIERAD